ncbi:MBL fold metallo-hydrolase [Candidatus Kaiserbacteria bacterium]|nr:MAG: MBL fold metallo-hydrolase [Candidatus Kaiserbacteria bacterium]
MIITHHKGEFIKVSFGDKTLAFNPVSKKSKMTPTRFGADIVFVTLNHPDFNGVDEVTRNAKEPFSVRGAGEYEIQGVFVKGFDSTSEYSTDATINTIYTVRIEDMNILFLGTLSDKKPNPSIVEDMDSVDVLFIPIGGGGVLDASEAHALAVAYEAKVVIPIHYDGIGDAGALKTFLKEAGAESTKPVEKLTIKRKDLEGKSGEVVVLQS